LPEAISRSAVQAGLIAVCDLTAVVIEIPGRGSIRIDHALLDVNGTLAERGHLLDGVEARIAALREIFELHLASADTFGTLEAIAAQLGVEATVAETAESKMTLLEDLGRERCAVVGNGANDASILEAAALGISVIGPEGASVAALQAADIVCPSIHAALDLLVDPQVLKATLRR
jgi:P-type E1-E2 ATPase